MPTKVNENKRCTDNLPSVERNALANLRQRTDIVIKPANKGSVVVVLIKKITSQKLTDN